jgi:integrase
MVNTLVWFLNWATDRGFNIYRDYKGFYKMLSTGSESQPRAPVYLEWEELMALLGSDIGETRKERVRDIFCFSCFTGLRLGELGNLRKEDVTSSMLTVRKSDGPGRQVPLNDYAKGILVKYENRYYRDNVALPPVSPVTVNKYLGILGRELKFTRLVPDPKGERKKRALWEVLTAGAGVQTFIMNAIRLDIPAEIISSFTGVANDQRVRILKHEMAVRQIKKFNEI